MARGPRFALLLVADGDWLLSPRRRDWSCATAKVTRRQAAAATAVARRAKFLYRYGVMETNQKAPAFTLPDENGNPVSLEQFRGKTVVVFFYPKAATPG
jgi:hypothetical protein